MPPAPIYPGQYPPDQPVYPYSVQQGYRSAQPEPFYPPIDPSLADYPQYPQYPYPQQPGYHQQHESPYPHLLPQHGYPPVAPHSGPPPPLYPARPQVRVSPQPLAYYTPSSGPPSHADPSFVDAPLVFTPSGLASAVPASTTVTPPTLIAVVSAAGVEPTPSPIKIKLRVPKAAPVMTNTRSASAGQADATALSNTGRARRSAAIAAQQSLQHIDEDDDDEEAFKQEDADADGDAEEDVVDVAQSAPAHSTHVSRSGRVSKAPQRYAPEDAFDSKMMDTSPVISEKQPTRRSRHPQRIVDPDDSDDNASPVKSRSMTSGGRDTFPRVPPANGRQTRGYAARTRHSSADGDSFNPDQSEQGSSPDPIEDIAEYEQADEQESESDDDLESYDEQPRRKTRSAARRAAASKKLGRRHSTRHAIVTEDSDDDGAPRKRNLRVRAARVNYQLPPADISAELGDNMLHDVIGVASGPSGRSRAVGFANGTRLGGAKSLPWSMKGKDFAQAMGDPDTSDSDDLLTPSKMGGHRASLAAGANGPSADVLNFGRVNPKSNMADADPLGVDVNVTFDRVGGLDDHINQLKEMVALPLLYPELFQQFGITPPRGVLFHGPPGTGKTLLARALAASCSNGNTKIAFFMRKGADVLSKWVGEAERQLRMLFEEARASQPSIIFFDEIDGLAPVRSSKQDQIHASLVSTLLALMDGMDGRGQVIVIGATNRPDAVDPALRRPGRFDREFYFPLPNIDARRKIIGINTRSWDPALDDEVLDRLAVLTKGYGGADLRALCTEAALNAIQRRYPQIYRTSDRLLLEPKSIRVLLKDFMAAVKKIVPSSARSSSSAAIQLPTHLAPLLSAHLERIQTAVIRALPENKKRSALEEAEWEEDDGRFENEVMLQTLDKMRTFRPRVLVHGNAGMGQNYLGPAILHHLEGFHVQSLDLATLLGDSTRTPEAALVQLFTEAKRHQPSVIYLPSLAQWASTLTDTARSTARALLDSVPPSDPILVLAVMDGDVEDLPRDVQGWFGVRTGDRIELSSPDAAQRAAFFADVLACVTRPPTDFPDALPRRKRVLEALPLAPPLPPRKPTEAELARETERDLAARNMMQMSFNSLVAEFNKKYKRATAAIREEVMMRAAYEAEAAAELAAAASVPPTNGSAVDNDAPVSSSAPAALETVNQPEAANAAMALAAGAVEPEVAPARPAPKWTAHDVDVDTLHRRLVRHKYYTPQDFLDDVARIEENAIRSSDSQGQLRVLEMVGHARSHVATFDPKWTPEFERYKERMLKRKEERKRKGEDLKAQEEEARFANGADPEATAGDAAGADASAHDTAAEASKRPREESEESDEARKRQKGMNIDPVSPHSLTADPAVSSIPASLTPLSPLPSTATVPPPLPPVYPPFVVPSLDKLATLLARTDAFNVDELEALRAGWVDRVWRSRAEWDRTEVVQELEGMVTRLIGEVEGRRMCEVEVD